MSVWNVVGLAGGLALFIFGMNLMSDGLKLVAGSYLKKILEKLTKNRILAMLVGAGLTALIQSSNAMCVMVVGFVNAGMMQLERSVGILMGAKIGTTITGQLIAFNIGQVAPVIAFIGVAVTMVAKKPKIKTVGQIITSLGVLFIGLESMKESMGPLKDTPWFQELLTNFSNPILCVVIGLDLYGYYPECFCFRRCIADFGSGRGYDQFPTDVLLDVRYEYRSVSSTVTGFHWWKKGCQTSGYYRCFV